jgi:RNA polymerase subunit RPABC4/transcription elongation factor Spt4
MPVIEFFLFVLPCIVVPFLRLFGLLYFLLPQNETPYKLQERGLRFGSFIRCPYCNTLVPGETVYCPTCESMLNEIVMPIRAYRPSYEGHSEIAACIRCGRLNGPKWTECKHCHTPLERPAKSTDGKVTKF